jgi:NitT/TauT family transport system substrate-binding protein
MISATLQGIQYTSAHPDEAYDISKKYIENLANADPVIQKQVLATSIEIWQLEHPGFSDPQDWQNMQDILLKMDLLKQPLDLKNTYTNDLLP